MIPEQRRESLIELLREQYIRSIADLTERLGVSHMTVRRDIAHLERAGRVIAVTGGVRLAGRMKSEPGHQDKLVTDVPYKAAMAAAAAKIVADNDAIYVDAGTSTYALVPHLNNRSGLTVVTNDFTIVNYLMDFTNIETFHTGGLVDVTNESAVGHLAAHLLSQLRLDLAVISSSGWDIAGVSTPSPSKVDVKRAAMAAADHSVLLADASKYGHRGLYRVCELSAFDKVFTDERLDTDDISRIESLGPEVTASKRSGR